VSEDARASRAAVNFAFNASEYPYYGDGGKVDLSNASQILVQYCTQVLKQSINLLHLCDVRKEIICKTNERESVHVRARVWMKVLETFCQLFFCTCSGARRRRALA